MDGTTTASFIVILVVGAVVGALVGAMLGGYLPPVGVALGAGIIATVVAAVIRNKLVNRASGAGPDEARIPTVLIVFGLIGAIAGSLAGAGLEGVTPHTLRHTAATWFPLRRNRRKPSSAFRRI